MTGDTTRRGYGYEHQRVRRYWAQVVDAGDGWCSEARCLMPSRYIAPGSAWDLAHTPDRRTYRGPAHQKCNRAEGGRRSRQRARGELLPRDKRPWHSREW